MKNFKLLVLVLLFGCTESLQNRKADIVSVDAEVIYPKIRVWTSPSAGMEAAFNSPSFQWPSEKNALYSIRISASRKFDKDLIQKEDITCAIFNPHKALEPGKWFWQYKINQGVWNEADSFLITANTPHFVPPDIQTLVVGIPKFHPRVLASKADLKLFRARAQGYKETVKILEEANSHLGKLPPKESSALPTYSGKNDFEDRKIALLASKWVGWNIYQVLDVLAQAYLLTGDSKYFETAKSWMLEVSKWDPKGPSHTNNFGDSGIMAGLAVGVDTFWDLLSIDERDAVIKQASRRADQFYQLWSNQVESRSSSMHVWQHILHRMFYTSLALVGEVPEAEIWLGYIYELWIAQAPKMGEKDGAWFNGTGYYSMNTLTMYDINSMLQELSGVDFMSSSWYENNSRWLFYAFPPGSVADGFCNNGDRLTQPAINYAGFADAAARRFKDPYAAWYASEVSKGLGLNMEDDHEFRWYRIQRGYQSELPEPIEKFDLPQAASFPDVGVAYMHTALQDAKTNLMLSIRSSPFGPMAHTHADQNTFNIAYGGERLFYGTGYRPAMGDPHYLGWHKHTQGHNGILIDGKGQPFDESAYGWLPRFLHGDRISYAVGDASNAYSGMKQEKTKSGMKRFRRHYLMLRPSTIVIYDDLEADHVAVWSWLLHNDKGFEIKGNTLLAENKGTKAKVSLYSSSPVDFQLTDQFSVPVDNWTNKVDEDGDTLAFEDQWHFKAISKGKMEKMRILAVFQIAPDGRFEPIALDNSDGFYQVGDWEIKAELDTGQVAGIYVNNRDGSVAFSSQGMLRDQDKGASNSSSAKLLEIIDGENVFREASDVLPKAIENALLYSQQE